MDSVLASIKSSVLVIYPDFWDSINVSEDFADLAVSTVVDRFLVYTNRDQLLAQYELDLIESGFEFPANYDYPVPTQLYVVLAQASIAYSRNLIESNTSETGNVVAISDNGKSVTFEGSSKSYFNMSDEGIFGSSQMLFNRYKLARVL